jgi:Leucine-rich repeat (LRR) protein
MDMCPQMGSLYGAPPHLRGIHMRNSNVSSLKWLSGCSDLEFVELQIMKLPHGDRESPPICDWYVDSPHLTTLDLSGRVRSLKGLEHCQQLTNLSLSNCEFFKGFFDLRVELPNLAYLALNGSGITCLNWLINFPNLKRLVLSGCNNLKKEDFKQLLTFLSTDPWDHHKTRMESAIPKLKDISVCNLKDMDKKLSKKLIRKFNSRCALHWI